MHLVLISPAGSYRTGDFLAAALGMGCHVTVVTDAEPAIPGSALAVDLADPHAAAVRILKVLDPRRVQQAGGARHAPSDAHDPAPALNREPIDGVVGTDGLAVAAAGEVARRLGLPANSAAALATAQDKLRQRRAAGAAGVAQPNFAALEVDAITVWSDYPAVVKPLDRAASQGVVRVNDEAELRAALTTVRGIVGAGATLLVESFVQGQEIAVEAILNEGDLQVLAVFDKPDTPSGPTFPETLLITPARLAPALLDRVVAVVGAALAAVGLREGPVHVECKVDGNDVWFLELAARTIGGWCSRGLRPGGIALEELVIRHALGLGVPALTGDGRASGALMLPVPRSGRVSAICGVDQAAAVQGVGAVAMSVGVGEYVVALPAGDRYLGFVFATAPTAAEVEAALRTAWSALTIRIE